MRQIQLAAFGALSAVALAAACGGQTFVGTLEDASVGDSGGDGASGDGGADAARDAASDASDAGAACAPPTGGCPDGGCPHGTVCVTSAVALGVVDLGCAPIPASCGGIASCDCMKACVCPNGGKFGCDAKNNEINCQSGAISRAEFKADIAHLTGDERAAIAKETLATKLARYRYKDEPEDARRRLGFIIDEMPNPSPAVGADRTHVDEYGYTSMLLATIQEQQKQIDALTKRLDTLEKHGRAARGKE